MQTLLVLNTKPELEEDLVDFLLSLKSIDGFTSYPVNGHGHHDNLSIAEQVTGRRKRLQVEIILDESEISEVLSGVARKVGRDVSWWQQAVAASGSLEEPGQPLG